ncbi:trypsin-like peptidase domain-containing protein [Nocardia huaxiensis]|uniref:Trypsin-like peptidase domain-containing protein n=1 Tax=Nocardia huaxiensis TaxID=2755382 RepID=A0A7D6VBE2_9NOCA|nr:trypsin-like peptidase domain-containing protein [Nocardia huaxiensis]QLY32221.1 trypsin-like peptidase domain-containing protein [Nocardia huaxiensis]
MRDETLLRTPPQGPRREGRGGRLLALFFAAVLGATAFLGYHGDLARWTLREDYTTAILITPPLPPLDTELVAGVVEPALVNVNSTVRPFGLGAAGSGIVLTAEGQVLTSHHVIKGAETVSVSDIGTGATYPARVLGYDSGSDIALLELTGADGLPAARIGTSAVLRLGDEVLAIGNAGGTGSPTAVGGPITGLDNSIVARNSSDLSRKQLRGMIEVSAAVAAGQSGGALVDRYGAVIGVVTAASGDLQKTLGRGPNGYAVPIDTAMHIVEQIRSGTPTDTVHIGPTAVLGVMTVDSQRPAGARIELTVQGQPAQAAGLAEGEVITAVDGRAIESGQALKAALNTYKPDDVVRLNVTEPGGAQRTVSVTLTVGPPN